MRIETKTENVENFHIVINDLHLNFPFVVYMSLIFHVIYLLYEQ